MTALRFATRTLAVSATAALLVLTGLPAHAADAPWYVSALKLDSGVADGLSGKGVTIAVIDGQINPEVPTLADADLQVQEPSQCYDESGQPLPATSSELGATRPTDHGTNVVSMIVGSGAGYEGQQGVVGVAPGATILYYASYTLTDAGGSIRCLQSDGGTGNVDLAPAIDDAVDKGADIISVSLNAAGGQAFSDAIARAFREGVVVVGSLPNSSDLTITGGLPGIANGTVSVQAAGEDGEIQKTDGAANRNPETDIVAPGLGITVQGNPTTGLWTDQFVTDGTSLATPLAAGILALVMEKYPDATGNQVLQSLIHNTSGTPDHEPVRDPDELIGYGLISVTNLLGVDPSTYDDVNPFIQKEAGPNGLLIPTYDEIFAATAAEPDSDAAPDQSAEPADASPVGLVVGIVVGGLVLVGAVVLAIIMVARKRSTVPKQ